MTDVEKQDQAPEVTDASGSTNGSVNGNDPKGLYDESPADGNELAREASRRSAQSEHMAEDQIVRMMSASRRVDTKPIPQMGAGKPYPPEVAADREPYRVEFDGPDDPRHPHNWPMKQKLAICLSLAFTTLSVVFGSAVFAPAIPVICEQYEVGTVVGILGITLYVIGFASGPIIWAPMSEMYGRKPAILASSIIFIVFMFGCGAAKDLAGILLCRFFAGFFGAAPLVVVAAAFADLFNNDQRGTAITVFALMVFSSPLVAPVVGGFIVNSYLGWRWVQYITGIMGSLGLVLDVFLYEETYHPIILARKARELRRRTGNWGIYAPHETVELDIHDIVTKNLVRPLQMLLVEPILLLLTIYTAFIYGILYLCLEAYPLIFTQYGFKGGVTELPYLSLMIGEMIACFISIFFFEPMYSRRMHAGGNKIIPENRLPPMMLGGLLFPIGIFWLCWAGAYSAHVHWIVPTIAGAFVGASLILIFLPAINYVVDSYLLFAASAMAGNTFLRSAFGAVFPLFANQMFNNLGIQWAGTLIGCIGVLLAPVPFLFYRYGKRLRQKSKFAFDLS